MTDVLLLAAHGSSTDASARDRIIDLADKVRPLVPHDSVVAAFARGTPSFETVVASLAANAHAASVRVTVVPIMTSAGYYTTEVLPRRLQDATGAHALRFTFTKPLGAVSAVAGLLHERAARQAIRAGWQLAECSVLLVGHGTRRNPHSRDTARAHARALRERGWYAVDTAFIDDDPGIAETLAEQTSTRTIVLPFLMGGADHALGDLPDALGIERTGDERARLVHLADRDVLLDAPLGTDPHLPFLVSRLARRGWERAHGARGTHGTPRRSGARGGGRVAIVGAGPGAADLLTVRAQRLLRWADVVVHDRLVSDDVLALARRDAVRVDVGKWPETSQSVQEHINAQLVQWARLGRRVVRLKGGDPMVFGRGSEEVEACQAAGVPVAVVPGISSALAAPAVVGIPVTARHVARSVAIVTAATATDVTLSAAHVGAVANADTVIVLMANSRLEAVCSQLLKAGRAPDTPVACIERATLPDQRVVRGTVATIGAIAREAVLQSPMVMVIGPTSHADEPDWSGHVGELVAQAGALVAAS